jgi:hypothetical protein
MAARVDQGPERQALAPGGARPGVDPTFTTPGANMNLKQTARVLSLAAMLGMAALSAPAFAADGDMMASRAELTKMANKDGMITKKDFMMMMEKKFDQMDKGNKGMLSVDDVMRIYGRSDKG